jgi:hypothetical protein
MKKAIAATLAACLLLCGCGNGIMRDENAPKEPVDGRFLCDNSWYDFETVVDTKTGVTYLIWTGSDHKNGITVLLNADGTPVISEEVSE